MIRFIANVSRNFTLVFLLAVALFSRSVILRFLSRTCLYILLAADISGLIHPRVLLTLPIRDSWLGGGEMVYRLADHIIPINVQK